MMRIKLNKEFFALVDDEDFLYLNQWHWYVNGGGYAIRMQRCGDRKNNKRKIFWMHRVILNPPKGMFTDHVNGNRLDNRRENLRICTHKENNRHKTIMFQSNKSGFRGVSWDNRRNKWRSVIYVNNKHIFLGRFNTKEEAAKAYNEIASEQYKNFAVLNII